MNCGNFPTPVQALRFAALATLLNACVATPPPATVTSGPALKVLQVQTESSKSQLGLPAFETAAERANRGLFDQYDDYRIAHKEWYARTEPPPPGKFRAMAEWEPMAEVWTTYSTYMMQTASKPIRRMFAEQTQAFAKVGKVRVIVSGLTEQSDFVAACKAVGMTQQEIDAQVSFAVLPNNAIWHIDYGAFPLVDQQDGHLALLDFVYYKNRVLDDAVPTRLAQEYYTNLTTYRMPFAFEGGNFQADGLGNCTTSNRALKNTGYSELKVKNILKAYAGCNQVLIMKDITDDGTGHIDMFFKWLGPDAVMIGKYEDTLTLDYDGDGVQETITMPDKLAQENSPDFGVPYKQIWAENKQRMDDNAALWAATTAPTGKKYTVHRLSMMTRFKDQYGDLPRTFINSTLFNQINVFPSYTTKSCRNPFGKACKQVSDCAAGQQCAAGKCTAVETVAGCDELLACDSGLECATDPLKVALVAQVQQQWQAALPSHTHIGLRADTIALQSGAIHCITRTIPAKPLAKTLPDGLCVQGTCGCVSGGANASCTDSAQCWGPAWKCSCNICQGKCASGKACTDDADCSADGVNVTADACAIDPAQGCYGQAASSGGNGGCGAVSFEGACDGAKLSYCDGGLQTQSCSGCCGWDKANNYFNCLTGSACSGCVDECTAGQGGCSSQQTHAWTCVQKNGCNKRVYSLCSVGCDAAVGKCKAGGSGKIVQECPAAPVDAGSTDASADGGGASDVQAADVVAGGTDVIADSSPADAGSAPADAAAADVASSDSSAKMDLGLPPKDIAKSDALVDAAQAPQDAAGNVAGDAAGDAAGGTADAGPTDAGASPDQAAADGMEGRPQADQGTSADQAALGDAGAVVAPTAYAQQASSHSGCTGGTGGNSAPLALSLGAAAWLLLRRRRA